MEICTYCENEAAEFNSIYAGGAPLCSPCAEAEALNHISVIEELEPIIAPQVSAAFLDRSDAGFLE